MASETEHSTVPPMPGYFHFVWLFFMQPLKLHKMIKAWNIDPRASLWRLRGQFDNTYLKQLLLRYGLMLGIMTPVIVMSILFAAQTLGFSVFWQKAARALVIYMVFGVALSAALVMAGGAAFGIPLGTVLGVINGLSTDGIVIVAGIFIAFSVS
jgi:hypothetical protein